MICEMDDRANVGAAVRRGNGVPEVVEPYNDEGKTIKRFEASLNRKGFPKGKTCAEFCAGKIQIGFLLGVILWSPFLHE